jgi:hypothetical protein
MLTSKLQWFSLFQVFGCLLMGDEGSLENLELLERWRYMGKSKIVGNATGLWGFFIWIPCLFWAHELKDIEGLT